MFEFKDVKVSENTFIRTIQDQRYTFENNKLISTEILSTASSVIIYNANLNYSDTNSVKITPLNNIIIKIKNKWNWIYNNKFAELFILYELTAVLTLFFLLFVVFPESREINMSLASYNIIKLRKVGGKHVWTDFSVNFNNKVFTENLFKSKFSSFWNKIENEFREDNHMFILFKIKYVNGDYSSIGKVQFINKSDKNWYIEFILENMKFKSEYYNETQIESIIFSYGFKKGKIPDKQKFNFAGTFQKYKNNRIPISMDVMDYGKLINQNNLENGMVYILQDESGHTITFNKFEKYNEIEFFKSGNSLIKFKDIFIETNKFMRKIEGKSFYFENGQQVLFTKEMKTDFISKTKKSKSLTNNFITLDIETYIQDNTLIPFLISFYDGRKSESYWLGDYESVELMILDCLKTILVRKYNGYKIYVHNLAKFDIIFLLKYLVKLGNLDPVIHNDRIISVKLNYGREYEYHIEFKDSYLLLLSSLAKLTRGFGVDTLKSVFPYLFVNENNLDYEGEVPDIKYFDNKIKLNEYNEYKNNFNNNWKLKNEAIKYCEIDCISLYQVVFKFNELIFNLFSKNIHHYPTLPSLAFGIFRSNFMRENTIPQLSGKIAKDIRSGYTGGSVDVFIPESKPGVKIKCYDVNSLYPYIMKTCLLPVGIPIYFEGDITKFEKEAFGFFYCEIIAPDNIKHPILQAHVKINIGTRTISPIGTWEDMMFSEEMNNARKYGYKFNVLWGYKFEKDYVFDEYVNFLYNLRIEYPKSHPLNFIAKILLNSLYGRFGMDDNFASITVIHKDYLGDFENKYLEYILEKIELNEYVLIRYKSDDETEDIGTHNVSISIAAAITAYSRIHMSQFKNNPKINLYYSDTDSAYTDSELPDELISDTILGKLKLENICNKAIFLAPKVYCLETEEGKNFYKVKGLKHEIVLTMKDYENLLYKNALIKKTQTKWIKNLNEGHIKLLEQVYTLKVTDSKRQLIYNKNNKLIGTKPYKINKK
uniref:DNA polymerase n=1 Tax=Russula rosea TaxID=176822 RepID=UPI002028EED3|nr:DNA polymerase [Russula rosea]UHA57019.1 DNA polymerase [Russula rosea]